MKRVGWAGAGPRLCTCRNGRMVLEWQAARTAAAGPSPSLLNHLTCHRSIQAASHRRHRIARRLQLAAAATAVVANLRLHRRQVVLRRSGGGPHGGPQLLRHRLKLGAQVGGKHLAQRWVCKLPRRRHLHTVLCRRRRHVSRGNVQRPLLGGGRQRAGGRVVRGRQCRAGRQRRRRVRHGGRGLWVRRLGGGPGCNRVCLHGGCLFDSWLLTSSLLQLHGRYRRI